MRHIKPRSSASAANARFSAGKRRARTPRRRGVRRLAALLAVLLAALLPGLSRPAAAQSARSDPAAAAVIAQNGGLYAAPDLDAYVARIGTRLLIAAGEPVRGWRFGILDNPVPNAYALPTGTILITRGMLALADDEAELAAVIAHELGHAVSGDGLAGVAGSGGRMAEETRADRLGLTTLAAAGYDPEAQPDILAALAASQTLAARIGGRVPAASSDHPGYGTRIAEARQQAAANGLRPGQGQRGRDAYLAAIDGLTWGDGPTQGFVSGRTFLHPKLGFAFDPPAGWRLENHPDAVVARGPNGATLVLDSLPASGAPDSYLLRGWAPLIARGAPVAGLHRTTIHGLPAAQATLPLGGTAIDLTVVDLDGAFYRLLATRAPQDRAAAASLATAAASFRALTAAEAAANGPLRIRIHRLGPGDNVAVLASRMPIGPGARDWFAILNGLSGGAPLKAGDTVKLVGR